MNKVIFKHFFLKSARNYFSICTYFSQKNNILYSIKSYIHFYFYNLNKLVHYTQ